MSYSEQAWHNTPEAAPTVVRVDHDDQGNLWVYLNPAWVKQFRIEEGDQIQMSIQRLWRKD